MQQNIVENSVMISEQKCIYLHGTQNLEPAIIMIIVCIHLTVKKLVARCNSVVRAFAHGVMSHRIDPLW